MKIASILAGVAVAALTASAASADPIYQGSAGIGGANSTSSGAIAGAILANAFVPGAFSVFTVSGGSLGNVGNASLSDSAEFTLKGKVTKDCVYYTGNASSVINFGTIGIYASENAGPNAAFDMVAPASVNIDTNLAGCNTSNTVKIQKNDVRGLVNNSGVGYDANVFQANLPYSVAATYTAGAVGAIGNGTSGTKINVSTAVDQGSSTHGAWKSAMSLKVNIPVADKALLAGDYEGKLTVSITAF